MPRPANVVDEGLGVVAGVRRVAVAGLVGDVGQRAPHLVVDRVGRQERLGVHRVHVVDAVEERRRQAAIAQGAGDDVEDHGAAQAADVDGAGRRLRVVDDLRSLDRCRQLVRPVHACVLRSGCAGPGGGTGRPPRSARAGAQLIDLIV